MPNSRDPKLTLYNFSVLRRLAAITLLLGTIVHAADLTTKLAHIMRSATAVVVDVSSGDEERRLQAIGKGDHRESRRSNCSQPIATFRFVRPSLTPLLGVELFNT
jgi:hypothetical protein